MTSSDDPDVEAVARIIWGVGTYLDGALDGDDVEAAARAIVERMRGKNADA